MAKKTFKMEEVIKKFNLEATGGGAKPFRKNLRFGMPVLEAFCLMDGKGFNEVFENICIDYVRTVPYRESKVKELDKEIAQKTEYIKQLKEQVSDMSWFISNINILKSKFADLESSTSKIIAKELSLDNVVINNNAVALLDNDDEELDLDDDEYDPDSVDFDETA